MVACEDTFYFGLQRDYDDEGTGIVEREREGNIAK